MIFLIDFAVGKVLSTFYFKQKSGTPYRTSFSINETKADLIVVGSSRANHHYHPDVFEKELALSFYNIGRDGQPIFYQYAVLVSILIRYQPKIIVLDFIEEEFVFDESDYERLSSLLPYYKSHPEISSIVELKSSFEKIKFISNIYPYNSLLFTIAIGNTNLNAGRRNNNDIKGYVPLKNKWNEPIKTYNNNQKLKIDPNKIKVFELFIQDCLKEKVKLYVVCSPYYRNFISTPSSIKLGKSISQKYNIDFYDFSQKSIFKNNSSLFSDPSHLNDDGARIFSDSIARIIGKN